ncbi:hypothetical protein GCM10027053_33140 [Intrasporangium mesophilum]
MATATASRESAATGARSVTGAGATVAMVALAWAVALPRLVPGTTGDHGTYVSVAERLLAGDRLYVDVWDNKDPLFYYLLAAGRFATPLADIVIEVLWVVVAAVAVFSIARMAGVPRLLAFAAAFGGVPLLLTGAAYEPGMTHLPGVALILAAVAVAARRRWVVAGIVVALILFLKLIVVPVAVAAVLVVAIHRRAWSGLLRAGAAAAVTAIAGVGVLWGRGELGGWLQTFEANVQYAEGDLSASRYGGAVGHVLRAFPEDSRGAGLATVASIVFALLVIRRSTAPGSGGPAGPADAALVRAMLWDATAVTLLLGLAVIAVTATWPHHLQALYVPGALALVLVAERLSQPTESWRAVVAVALAAYLIGGALHPYYSLTAVRDLGGHVQELRGPSPDSRVLQRLPQVGTYARAGSNDVTAHAIGLRDEALACPRFHQYSIDTAATLQAVAACLPTADAVIVDDTLQPEPDAPQWNAYVARVRALVATGYVCVPTSVSQVCLKQGR